MVAAVSNDGGKPFTRLETVTPAMAAKWLEQNRGNRNPSNVWVNSLARDILAGRWQVDGNTIRFSRTMRLLDGQHRLLAIVQSGRPVETLVSYNLHDEAMDVIDRGKMRSVGDLLKINMSDRIVGGEAARIAAICLSIARLETGTIDQGTMRLTYGEAVDIYKRYEPDIRWAMDQIGNRIEPANSSGGAPVLSAFAFCRRIDVDKMERCAYQYKHGEPSDGRSRMAPQVRLLRTAVVNSIKSSTHVRRELVLRALRCIEAYLNNEELHVLKIDNNVIERISHMRVMAMRGGK